MNIKTFCQFPFNRVRVTSEGNVSMCCFQRPDPLKDENIAYIGNVLNNTFDEVWYGELAEEIRQETLKGNLHKNCQCPGCPVRNLEKPYPEYEFVYNEYPNFLEIDLPNTHCNVGGKTPSGNNPACIMCERSSPHFKPEENHLHEVLGRISHLLPNLHQIHIQGIAEPFFPSANGSCLLFEAMDVLECEKHKDNLIVSVTTNGTIFNRSIRQEYLERFPNSMTNFSIDASTSETFKNIRILDCFEKVLNNLYSFDEERSKEKQIIRLHSNINTMNINEVVGMVHIANKAHAECIEFNPTNGFNHKILVNKKNCGLFRRAQKIIIEECEKIDQPYDFIQPLDLNLTSDLL